MFACEQTLIIIIMNNSLSKFSFYGMIINMVNCMRLKISLIVKKSFSAWISFAWAPARDDSDWATSDNEIWPLSSLILSVSTCLSNKLTFDLLIFSFSFAEISPV